MSSRVLLAVALATLLGACAQLPPPAPGNSACAQSETSYECQVERYRNVNS